MEPIRSGGDQSRPVRVRDLLKTLVEEKRTQEKRVDTKKASKPWKWPYSWKGKINRVSKMREHVVLLYLNIKGEIEQPMIVPLYGGNMVIIRNKVHEVDPRAFWSVRIGVKHYKVLLIKEIDRRPVSNLDYSEIRKRGDATDSDEFLIKAALRAQTQAIVKPMNRAVILLIGLAILAVVGYIIFAS